MSFASPMRRALVEWQRALVKRVDFRYLSGMPETGGQSKVGVAAGVREDLHFGIDAAPASPGGVGEREVSVHESVFGSVVSFFSRQAVMTKSQSVAELEERAPCVFGSVWRRDAMVKMNL